MINICKKCNKRLTSKYQICKMIGYGSFADIYSVCNKDLIIKKFFQNNRELELGNLLNNLNKYYLLKPIKIEGLRIIYPRIYGDTLRNYFGINLSDTEESNYKIIKKIFNILLDLENEGLNHFDISPDNIMIEKDTGNIYLIDYNYLSKKCLSTKLLGSWGYVPPEKISHNQIFFNKFDIYSFCCIIGEFVFRNPCFKITNFKQKCVCFNKCANLQQCLDNQIILSLENINNIKIKQFYKILLTNGLQLDHTKRKSFNEINELIFCQYSVG
jgi:serine/threonine protein kinase